MTVRAEIRPLPEPPREVVLTMPLEVAKTLRVLVGSVAGATDARHHLDQIRDALAEAGLPYSERCKGLWLDP